MLSTDGDLAYMVSLWGVLFSQFFSCALKLLSGAGSSGVQMINYTQAKGIIKRPHWESLLLQMWDLGGLPPTTKKKKRLLDSSSKDQEIEVTRDLTGSQRRLHLLKMVAEVTDPLDSSYACLVGPTIPKCRSGKTYMTNIVVRFP